MRPDTEINHMIYRTVIDPNSRFSVIHRLIFVSVLIFTALRIAFLFRMWPSVDHNLSDLIYIFGIGLIYDLAFLGYAAIPFILCLLCWPNKWLNCYFYKAVVQTTVYIILLGIFFSLVAEWLFWDDFGVRFNFIAVDYLVYRREVTNNIIESYNVPWILTNIFFVTTSIFILLRKFLFPRPLLRENLSKRFIQTTIVLLIPAAAFFLLGQAQRNFSNNNYTNEIASNGLYQLFAAFKNNSLDYQQFYALGSDEILSAKLKENIQESNNVNTSSKLYNIGRHIESKGPEKRLNVILISIESLSAEFLSRFGSKEGPTHFKQNVTPFLDQWLTQGMLFTNFYATGTRTTRGLEAITLSIPPTPGRSLVKRPDNDHIYSLGKVFKDKNYDVAFLYGGRGYFDNMNTFFSGNGYRIVDQTDFSKEEISFKNAWGVADEDLYRRTIREANQVYKTGKPFFFHVMTTSNHRPFTYPADKIDIPSGTGGRAGGIKYTDYALKQLVQEAKEQPWFSDTIFVIVADHCAASAGKVGLDVDKYHIPMFFYAPKYIKPEEIDLLASQIDLAPTLLEMLNFSYDSFFFGKDIMSPSFKGRALIANYQKLGLFDGNNLVILSPRKEIDLITLSESNKVILQKITPVSPLVSQCMSFYQGADYILKNRLNRWNSSPNTISIGK